MSDLTDRLTADNEELQHQLSDLRKKNVSLQEIVNRKDQIIISQGHLIKRYQNKVKQLDGFNGGMGN